MNTCLFEVISEEIPAKFQPWLLRRWHELIPQILRQQRLTYRSVAYYAAPRRIAFQIQGLNDLQDAHEEWIRGPNADVPSDIVESFCRRWNKTLNQAVIQEEGKKRYWFIKHAPKPQLTLELLPSILEKVMQETVWPHMMTWNKGKGPWVRPIRRIVALWNEQSIPFHDSLSGLKAETTSLGTGLEASTVVVPHAANYTKILADHGVIPCWHERRNVLVDALSDAALKYGGTLDAQDLNHGGLVDEVVGFVDQPYVMVGHLDEDAMSLPEPIVTTPLRHHQRAFPLYQGSKKTLLPYFLVVLPKAPQDTMRTGHERVARARLADAAFFWQQDKAHKLSQHAQHLNQRTFLHKLGSLYDKAQRLVRLSLDIFPQDNDLAQACLLCQADSVTLLGEEFPQLQGILGGLHAQREGLSLGVVEALKSYTWPHGLYKKPVQDLHETAKRLIFLDRIDMLVGFLGLGNTLSSSKDPLGLRRAATTAMRVLVHLESPIALQNVVRQAVQEYQKDGVELSLSPKFSSYFIELMQDRLEVLIKEEEWEEDLEEPFPLSLEGLLREGNFHSIYCQRLNWARLSKTQAGILWSALVKRLGSFLGHESLEENPWEHVDEHLFVHPAEKNLWNLWPGRDHLHMPPSYTTLSQLKDAVDTFFQEVSVLKSPEPEKTMRLNLVRTIYLWVISMLRTELSQGNIQ